VSVLPQAGWWWWWWLRFKVPEMFWVRTATDRSSLSVQVAHTVDRCLTNPAVCVQHSVAAEVRYLGQGTCTCTAPQTSAKREKESRERRKCPAR
jgi:hypothetical protein